MLIKELLSEELLSEDEEIDYEIFEEEDQVHRIWLEQRALYVKEFGIKLKAGYYEVWDEESEDYEMDFDFYMIFDAATNEHLYEEAGSSLEVCIYNYLRSLRKGVSNMNEIEELECEMRSEK